MMKKLIPGIIIVLLIAGAIFAIAKNKSTPGQYDQLAQCINDSGTKFYGAFWCPHCQATKAMFGKSVKLLPYIECSLSNGKDQTQICIDNQIEGYPTWDITKPITITSDTPPTICQPTDSADAVKDADICKQPGIASKYRTVWVFAHDRIIAKEAPTITKNTWIFPVGSRLSGELTIQEIASRTGCELPTTTTP